VGEVLVVIIAEIGQAAGGSTLAHPSPAVSLLSDVAVDGAFVAAALALTWLARRSRPAASEFGYRRTRPVPAGLLVVAAAVAYYLITFAYAALFGLHGKDKLPSELGVHHSTAALIGAALFVCVVAPVAEEFFFRGFLFGALSRWRLTVAGRPVGIVVAAVVVGLLFGLAHTGSASPEYLIPLAFLGFVLCLLRWRTGSLYPCMALHSLNNCLALGVNELHWSAGSIAALVLTAVLVIAAITGPLAGPPQPLERPGGRTA
jgi:membrane protease YdiL (CAAX protease family)